MFSNQSTIEKYERELRYKRKEYKCKLHDEQIVALERVIKALKELEALRIR